MTDKTNLPAVPDPDLDTLLRQTLPADWQEMAVEDFAARGRRCVEWADYAGQTLGALVAGGWEHLADRVRPDGPRAPSLAERGRLAWAEWCAALFGCSRPTVTRAWLLAAGQNSGYLAGPHNQTRDAAILAACDGDVDAANAVLDLADLEGWKVEEVRTIKRLQARGLLEEGKWELPRLRWEGEYIVCYLDGEREVIARRITNLSKAASAGLFLLCDGRVERETITVHSERESEV